MKTISATNIKKNNSKVKLKHLVVLLENCLKDVSKKEPEKRNQESFNSTANVQAVCNSDDESNLESDYGLSSDSVEHESQALTLNESSLLQLPILNKINRNHAENSILEDEIVLGWEKLAEPTIFEDKTPLASENSSVVDMELNLTPPCSLTSGDTSFTDNSITSDDNFMEDFNRLPAPAENLQEKSQCKEFHLAIPCFEPTLKQLQVLYRRKRSSRTAPSNNLDNCRGRRWSLRPKDSLKQFVPYMYLQGEYTKKNLRILESQKKRRKAKHFSKVCTSTPKNTSHTTKVKEAKKKRLSLKQKETIHKKQLKLELQEKKAAIKCRNKFENSLNSINRRLYNQNYFWRMTSVKLLRYEQ